MKIPRWEPSPSLDPQTARLARNAEFSYSVHKNELLFPIKSLKSNPHFILIFKIRSLPFLLIVSQKIASCYVLVFVPQSLLLSVTQTTEHTYLTVQIMHLLVTQCDLTCNFLLPHPNTFFQLLQNTVKHYYDYYYCYPFNIQHVTMALYHALIHISRYYILLFTVMFIFPFLELTLAFNCIIVKFYLFCYLFALALQLI
jgi:hypothetical protein